MQTKLFWVGTLLSAAAALLGVVSTNMHAGGIPADVHPVGAVAVGVSAIAFLYASTCTPK
jgi:hypothetical protein